MDLRMILEHTSSSIWSKICLHQNNSPLGWVKANKLKINKVVLQNDWVWLALSIFKALSSFFTHSGSLMILSSPGHSKTYIVKRNKNKYIKSKLCLPRTLSGASLFTFQFHILSCRVNFSKTDHIKEFSYDNLNEF